MKTINFELSKRLNEAGVLDDIETEFKYYNMGGKYILLHESEFYSNNGDNIKTLTLEEAIEKILPKKFGEYFSKNNSVAYLKIYFLGKWNISYGYLNNTQELMTDELEGKTQLEAVEKMLEYLLDNNLLGNAK